MDKELDKAVDAVIDDAIAKEHERYNYDEEMDNYEEPCQAVYYLRKGIV